MHVRSGKSNSDFMPKSEKQEVRRPSLIRASLYRSQICPVSQTTRSESVQIEVAHSVMSMRRILTQRTGLNGRNWSLNCVRVNRDVLTDTPL
jgi:hypothetical protein